MLFLQHKLVSTEGRSCGSGGGSGLGQVLALVGRPGRDDQVGGECQRARQPSVRAATSVDPEPDAQRQRLVRKRTQRGEVQASACSVRTRKRLANASRRRPD